MNGQLFCSSYKIKSGKFKPLRNIPITEFSWVGFLSICRGGQRGTGRLGDMGHVHKRLIL